MFWLVSLWICGTLKYRSLDTSSSTSSRVGKEPSVMKNHRWMFTGIACTLIASSATADIIYDNFGPDDSFNTEVGSPVGGFGSFIAYAFTVTGGDYALTNLVAPIGFIDGTNKVLLTIYSDFFTPFTLLETSEGSGFQDVGTPISPSVFAFSGDTDLKEGERYWVSFEPKDISNDRLTWFVNDQGANLPRSVRFPGGSWNVPIDRQAGAMRVEGVLVPAPSPAAAICIGMSATLMRRRR